MADCYKSIRLQKASPTTVNIELRTVRSALGIAHRWGIISSNPLAGLKQVRVSDPTRPYFTKEQFGRLMSTIEEDWLASIIRFTALTGLRRGEVTNVRWENVDLGHKLLRVQSGPTFKTKTGRSRTIPLSDQAVRILHSMGREDKGGLVFTLNGRKIYDDWLGVLLKRYVRKLGMDPRLTFHSLRHSHGSWLAMDGVSIYHIAALLGHSDVKITTEYYAHLEPGALREAVERLDIDIPPNP